MSKQNRTLNVMHITFDMRIGGTEMVIKNIIESADPNRFNMSIYCIEQPLGPWGMAMQENGVLITTRARKEGFDTSMVSAIREHVKKHDIDIVHCHQYTPWVYGALAALGLKTKVVFTEHGRFYPDSSSWKRKLINPILCRSTDAITAISEATKCALLHFEFLSAYKIKVIYNGIKPIIAVDNSDGFRKKLNIPSNVFVLGTVARFDPIKNHEMMIKALRRCLDKDLPVKLIIVGDGENRKNLEMLIQELDLVDHVLLPGYQPDPANFMNLFDIFLLTSFSEGTSMTLLEAMTLSKPCIVSDVGGNPEVIVNESNGLVIPSNDDKALEEAIFRMVNDSQTIRTMQVEANKRYISMFSDSKMASEYSQLYASLAQ